MWVGRFVRWPTRVSHGTRAGPRRSSGRTLRSPVDLIVVVVDAHINTVLEVLQKSKAAAAVAVPSGLGAACDICDCRTRARCGKVNGRRCLLSTPSSYAVPVQSFVPINFRRGLQHVRDVNPCDTTVEGRLRVNSAELDQLDSTALGLEKPLSKCSMFGREGDSSISSSRFHQSSPYREQDYKIPYMVGKLSLNRTPFTRELVKHVLGMGYFSAVPSETRKDTNTSSTSPFN